MPLAQNIKRYFSLKAVLVAVTIVMVSVLAGTAVFLYLVKDVIIFDNGEPIEVRTMKTTVSEVLEQNSITIGEYDYINLPLDQKLHKTKNNEIYIKRAVPVHVTADNKEITLMTCSDTVGEALEKAQITISAEDRLEGAKLSDKVSYGMKVSIIRVTEEMTTEEIPIPFKVVRRENNRMDEGRERVAKEGREGVREKTFKIVLENGKEVARELIKDAVALLPADKVVEFGTILNHKTSRGDIVRYKKVLNVKCTAYTASYKDTGKKPGAPGFGITRSGLPVRRGIIAVDPKVIPLGTRVYVEIAGKTPDYGYAVAADTGGAVKGNIIDVYVEDQKQSDNWGVKRAKVYILY